jgi:histidine triad (HIT) family protein
LGCVFCEIINGAAFANVIYQDNDFIAILDKHPISIGHTLVMPKKHLERVNDFSQTEFSNLYARVHALNRVITSRLKASASHISVNDGEAANQLIPHLHVHIIPRNMNDGVGFTSRKLLPAKEMDELRKQLQIHDLKINV